MVMSELNIFVSVGGTATEEQEKFVQAIESRLKSEGMTPHTVGRNTFDSDSPLKTVMSLMDTCSGAVIIALERLYFPTGCEKRGGGPKEIALTNTKLPTCWNQIEAAMAYSRGLPLMVIMEEGVRNEGLLERGNDWYIQWIKPEPSALTTAEFNGVLAGWKKKVEKVLPDTQQKINTSKDEIAQQTIGEIISSLKPAQLWSVLVALVALVAGAFTLGAKLLGPGAGK